MVDPPRAWASATARHVGLRHALGTARARRFRGADCGAGETNVATLAAVPRASDGAGLGKQRDVVSAFAFDHSYDSVSPELRSALLSIYEEIMWLSARQNVTSSRARAWYTHVMAESVKRRVRQFTGQVSRAAIAGEGTGLRLEHYKRIQNTLTNLVARH